MQPPGAAGPGQPDPGAGGGAPPSPAAGPMSTPQEPRGQQAGAKVSVQVALKLLEQSLVPFGSGSQEGGAIMKAITALTKAFGRDEEKSKELMPAELKQALMGPGGAPGAPPGGGPPGGAAPPGGGAPPGMM